MPSKSKKQRKLFQIAAHDPEFAKKVGVDPEVAKEFYEADKRKDAELKEKAKDRK